MMHYFKHVSSHRYEFAFGDFLAEVYGKDAPNEFAFSISVNDFTAVYQSLSASSIDDALNIAWGIVADFLDTCAKATEAVILLKDYTEGGSWQC